MTMNLLPLTKKSYLNVSYSIYRNLYTSKHKASNDRDTTVFFEYGNDNVLHDYEQKACEGVLTEKECLEALKDMESDKTTGTDGLPAEFYKVFWKDISTILIESLLRKNDNISGILVNNKEIKLSQYADDTTLILDGSRESLTASLKTLNHFYEISGLKLNDKKTEAL